LARDYEAWWRISKFDCYLAVHTSGREMLRTLPEAVAAGEKAVALEPARVEGHFWLGTSYGLSVEQRGMLAGLRMVDTIRAEMETVVRIDPDYEQGAGLQTLARICYSAPFFKGGDKRRSIELLQANLRRFPGNSLTMLYLADSLLAVHRRDEARDQLQHILKLCPDPLNGPELAENQVEARKRLAEYLKLENRSTASASTLP
jgi:tetratricopeptide (TPR) repeat protein